MKKLTGPERAERHANRQKAERELDEVRAYGYRIHKFSDVHWRVSHPDTDLEADIWPTTRKLMSRETWRPEKYASLLEAIQRIYQEHL